MTLLRGSDDDVQMAWPSKAASPRRVPGPRGSLLLGSTRALARDPLRTYERARQRYGDVVRFDVGPPGRRQQLYGVFHPDGVQHVLTGEPTRYRRDLPMYAEVARVFGNGLLTSEGDVWRRQRRTTHSVFTRQRVGSQPRVCHD